MPANAGDDLGGNRAGSGEKDGVVKVKGTYWIVNVKLLQCAGLVVTPKLPRVSIGMLHDNDEMGLERMTDLGKATKNVATDAYW